MRYFKGNIAAMFVIVISLFLISTKTSLAFTTCSTDADCGGATGSCATFGPIQSCYDSSGNESPDFLGNCSMVVCPPGYTCQTRPAGKYCRTSPHMAATRCPEGQEFIDGSCQAAPTAPTELDVSKIKGLSASNPAALVNSILKWALGLIGTVALLFFLYGGILWLTSGGSPDKIKKAQQVMVWATIGIVVIFASYAIVSQVITAVGG